MGATKLGPAVVRTEPRLPGTLGKQELCQRSYTSSPSSALSYLKFKKVVGILFSVYQISPLASKPWSKKRNPAILVLLLVRASLVILATSLVIFAESLSSLGLSFSTYKKSAHFIVLKEIFESRNSGHFSCRASVIWK